MINLETEYSPNTNGTSGSYPFGEVRNDTVLNPNPSQEGTPVDEKWMNDIQGFFQAILSETSDTPNNIPEAVGASQLLSSLLKIFPVTNKNQHKFIICRIQNTGGGWALVPGAINATAVAISSGVLTITHNISATAIRSMVVVPSRHYADKGIFVGGNSSANSSDIYFSAKLQFDVTFGSSPTIDAPAHFGSDITVPAGDSAIKIVTHPAVLADANVVGQKTFADANFTENLHVGMFFNTTTITFQAMVQFCGRITVETVGNTWSYAGNVTRSSEISYNFNTGTGLLTVTHTFAECDEYDANFQLIHDLAASPGIPQFTYSPGVHTKTTFTLTFINNVGDVVTTEADEMDFYFTRSALVASDVVLKGTMSVKRDNVRLDAANVSDANGYIDILGLAEY